MDFLTGRLLIAMPGIDDPRFERAVILMCAHSPDHAMGIAVNRPLDGLTVPDLLDRLGVEGGGEVPATPVLFGGPVERERGFVLHTDDYESEQGTISVAEGVSLTATRDVLQAMASSKDRPRRSVLALGYAGWGPGQLEAEISQNAWLTVPADAALLFDTPAEERFIQAYQMLGVDPALLSPAAGHG